MDLGMVLRGQVFFKDRVLEKGHRSKGIQTNWLWKIRKEIINEKFRMINDE
jgi:hypothetical protein